MQNYEELKDSGVYWIGKIPEHWETIKLGLITNLQQGLQIPFQDRFFERVENSYEYITTKSIHNPEEQRQYIKDPKKNVLCTKEDILYGRTGNTGEVVTNVEGVFHNNFFKVLLKSNKVFKDYLILILSTSRFKEYILLLAGTTTISDLNHGDFKSTSIPLPPFQEQIFISKYIDKKTQKIDTLIKKIEKKIELLNEQKIALINKFVTKGLDQNVEMKDSEIDWIGEIPKHWEITKLKYESDLIVDGSHFTPNYVEDGVPFLRVTDLTYENISLDKVKFISYSEHSELSKRCHPKKGDLLLSKNGTIGKTRIIDWDWDFSIFVSLCLIRLKDEYSSNLLSLFFESNLFDTQIKEGSKQSTVTNLHLDKIREFVLIKPPIKEQNLIVRTVKESIDPIFNLIKLEEQKLSLLREYLQSLISSVVTGKIRITEDMI